MPICRRLLPMLLCAAWRKIRRPASHRPLLLCVCWPMRSIFHLTSFWIYRVSGLICAQVAGVDRSVTHPKPAARYPYKVGLCHFCLERVYLCQPCLLLVIIQLSRCWHRQLLLLGQSLPLSIAILSHMLPSLVHLCQAGHCILPNLPNRLSVLRILLLSLRGLPNEHPGSMWWLRAFSSLLYLLRPFSYIRLSVMPTMLL